MLELELELEAAEVKLEYQTNLPQDSNCDSQDVRYVFVRVALAAMLEHCVDLDRMRQDSTMVCLWNKVIDTGSGGLGLEESYTMEGGHQVVLLGLEACLRIDQVIS